jgi:hypothetical protein
VLLKNNNFLEELVAPSLFNTTNSLRNIFFLYCPKDGGSKFSLNIGDKSSANTVSYPMRLRTTFLFSIATTPVVWPNLSPV